MRGRVEVRVVGYLSPGRAIGLIGLMMIIFRKYFKRRSKIIFRKNCRGLVRISPMKILKSLLIVLLDLASFVAISLRRLSRELWGKMVPLMEEMDLLQKIVRLPMR